MKRTNRDPNVFPTQIQMQSNRDQIVRNQFYAPQAYLHRVYHQYIDIGRINRTRDARKHRFDILKSKRIAARRRLAAIPSLPDIDGDFVYFAATDSESETDEVEFDDTDHRDGRLSKNNTRKRAFPMGLNPADIVKPGLSDNGYYDNGDPTFNCLRCGAYMWYGERLNKKVASKKPKFGVCCKQGKVVLPVMRDPPGTLAALLYNGDDKSTHYRELVRAYNMIFAFTSLGGKIDHSVNDGKGPYLFQLSGENYHLIGDLFPKPNDVPAFLQLYIHDTVNEVANRKTAYGKTGNASKISEDIIKSLKEMLDAHNSHVKAFRTARERFAANGNNTGLKLVLYSDRKHDGRTHNLPTSDEVAGLVPGDFEIGDNTRDIILETTSGKLQRISELHPAYLPLQYPLLFPYREDGFRLGIDIGYVGTDGKKRKNVTMREFFAYRIQTRIGESPIIPMSGRLFQQFLVDAYTMIETNRLRYIYFNQKNLRCENYERIKASADRGDHCLENKGTRIFIPSSFTGGSRYMMQHYLDAMATCKYFGYPDIFITITCNPKWPEITRYLEKHALKAEDRPDIMCRVFKMKLDNLVSQLTTENIFGNVSSALYTIEFQKRGLHHAHMVLFLGKDSKIPTGDDIDKFISAEIPDKELEPHLYDVVSDCMIHGPCGVEFPSNVCMRNGKCSKFFPKPSSASTTVNDDGYPLYRRRKDDKFVEKRGFRCDNGYVVPYNKTLLLRYRAHINVEWCNQSRSIKYLFKYIHKGPDYISAAVQKEDENGNIVHDEIEKYFSCRYISACEATWRILAFPTHHRTTSVIKLSFHAPGKQYMIYNPDDPIDEILSRKSVNHSMFLAMWKIRERGFAIGRITHVPRSSGEDYYLRILLNKVEAPKSFDEIKTYNGVVYKRFQDTCYAMGLLDDDKEYIDAIKEASFWATGFYLRKLFVIMLLSASVADPLKVWNESWLLLSEDLVVSERRNRDDPGLTFTDSELQTLGLIAIEDVLRRSGKSLANYGGMPCPDLGVVEGHRNILIRDELAYDTAEQRAKYEEQIVKLTAEQKKVYQEILDAVLHDKGGVFFVYGFGGTGKTFLWSILSAVLRSQGLIVLNVVSSGIASLLLPGGRTAHSRFGIPLVPTDFTSCSIKGDSDLAALIRLAKLTIWDEAPMMSKFCFESLDRSMRDIIRDRQHKPFGGKVVVFGGDFRQILPVIVGAGREQTVLASLNASYLWSSCKVLTLTKNMRLTQSLDPKYAQEIESFSKWILDVGDGKINSGEVDIDIPEDLLITDVAKPLEAIVNTVYGDQYYKPQTPKFLRERAILSPTNKDVDAINEFMLSKFEGNEQQYLSSDSIEPADETEDDRMVYSQEFLNSVNGQKIHAVVEKATANRYAKTLVEGNWLSITNFELYPVVDGQLRLTSHSFTIHWKPSTLARKLKSLGSGDYFDFVSFERAKSGLLDHNLCIDLVGRVMNVSIFDEDQQEGSNWDQLYFELENARGVRMQCRMPKEYSDEFFAGWKTCVGNIIMCILRFARLETSLGNVRVTTANMCTRIMFNHPCVEVQELRQFFVDQEKQ
ncbi:unnamed protein product [Arabidopsis halleri]